MLTLKTLKKTKLNKKKRIGRGIGSGCGKTSGRGVKGQKARTGSAVKGFEGGQTPIQMRIPKRGFKNHSKNTYETVTARDVTALAKKNKLATSATITKENLKDFGLIKNTKTKVKLIGGNQAAEGYQNIKIVVDLYSESSKIHQAA